MAAGEELTIELNAVTARKVRQLAAERGVSVDELVASAVERLWDEYYVDVRNEALNDLSRGFDFGAGPLPSRESLYDR